MGIPELLSIALDGLARLILGTLAVFCAKNNVVSTLGIAWLILALIDFLLIVFPAWETFREASPYLTFSAGMLWIGAYERGWFKGRQSPSR